MKVKSILLLIFSYLLCSMAAKAQNTGENFADSLAKHFDYYRLKNPQSILFAHFDKTVYTNNENVWFTAYLLNSDKSRLNDVLSAVLVKDDDRSIALGEKFVMADGIAFGNLFLPDSIPSGDYSFILYTNEIYNGKPANIFVQPVTIKNMNEEGFHAALNLLDTGKFPADGKRKVRLVTSAKGATIVSGATVSYYAGDKAHPFFSGQVKTDHAGQYVFSVPVAGISTSNNIFEAKITFGKESNTAQLALPVYSDVPQIKFYPEGGNLSDGVLSTVGWEAKDLAGAPLEMGGVLYKDDKPRDTVYTDTYGMGKFKLYPQVHSRYYLRPLGHVFKDSVYALPGVMLDQPVIAIAKAIADDTLNLIIRAKTAQKVFVVAHNFGNVFFNFETEATTRGKPVKVILDELPRGVVEITVLDSLRRPCAERLFFAHYDRRNILKINTDTDHYKKRQKVSIDLKLMNADGKAAGGLVSVACIQANRYEIKKAMDIESYFYLVDQIGRLPIKEHYMGTSDDDRKYLEDILLVKGWRRYTWPELVKAAPRDTAGREDTLFFNGALTRYGKPLKKPGSLLMFKDSSAIAFKTDLTGRFIMTSEQLFTHEQKDVKLLANSGAGDEVKITLSDPYKKIDDSIALNFHPFKNIMRLPGGTAEDTESLLGIQRIIQLKQVSIKADKDDRTYGIAGTAHENECGDYVCKFNILNCPNHRDDPANRPAVLGQTYTYKGNPYYTYEGCIIHEQQPAGSVIETISSIHYSVGFYPADYSKLNPIAPEYVSTIYWNHLLKLSPATKNTVSFYTSDITGDFKIIVQGISQDDVVYGEKTFMVVK